MKWIQKLLLLKLQVEYTLFENALPAGSRGLRIEASAQLKERYGAFG